MEIGLKMARIQNLSPDLVQTIRSHDLARQLHEHGHYFLLDCRPVLAYNSCHISGAINVNFTRMIKKRFIAGKMELADLFSQEGKEKFQMCLDWPTVVYDDCTAELRGLPSSTTILLVLAGLEKMGKCPYLLQGGLNEFGVLHPSLCEVSVPSIKKSFFPAPRASTPGFRDQPLDWQTAPPVHVLSYLVLGSEKDAKCWEVIRDFKVKYVINVTPKCPNHFEKEDLVYKRIAVTDTGSQKLSNHFFDAFKFIEEARQANKHILIHCMAGISRSVTLTIAYLMYHFGMSMHSAYQFVKEKRPAISPNLNFMGQLVEFEKELATTYSQREILDINLFLPTLEQERLSKEVQGTTSSGSSAESTPEASKATGPSPFILKLPAPRHKKGKNKKLSPAVQEVQTLGECGSRKEIAGTDATVAGGETANASRKEKFQAEMLTSRINRESPMQASVFGLECEGFAKCNQIDVPTLEMDRQLKVTDIARRSPVLRQLESDHVVETAIQSFEKLASSDSSVKLSPD